MATPRILVVDDDPIIQQLLRVNLELDGYRVEIAADGEAALERFAAFQPDLVLLDIMMPKIDGWQVASRMQQRHQAVPIVLLSARAQDEDRQRGDALGAVAYVTKPFDPGELLRLVARVVANGAAGC